MVGSFSGTLKLELLYALPLQTRAEARVAVAEYIEDFYNGRRRHSSLDCMSQLKNGGGRSVALPPTPPSFLHEEEIRKDWVSRS